MNQPVTHIESVRAAFSQPFQITVDRIGCPWKADLYKLGMPVDYVASQMALIPERPFRPALPDPDPEKSLPQISC